MRGGVSIPNARPAQSYALSLGGPKFQEAYRPTALLGGGGAQGSGELLDLLGLPHALSQGYETDPQGMVGQPTLNLLGRFNPAFLDGRQFTNADVNQFLQHGAGSDIMNTLKNDFDLYGSAWSGGPGKVDRNVTAQLNAFQPGGYEQGLRGLFGAEGSPNMFMNGSFAQQQQQAQANDPMLQQLQQYLSSLGRLHGGLPQITQGLQDTSAGLDPGVVAALQGSPGFTSTPNSGGGVDLQALLRQLGLAA